MKKIISVLAFSLMAITVFAQQSIIGRWKTIDDENGEAKSYVEIWQDAKSGIFFGKITQLLQKPADTRCEKCTGSRANQPVVGMIILWDMKSDGSYWKDGRILDPTKGSDYSCSMWFENGDYNTLNVRGKHWSGIYRTQKWSRL